MRNPTSWESAIEYGRKMYWRGFRHSLLWLCAALLLFFGAGYSVAQADVLSLGNIYIDGSVIASNAGEYRIIEKTYLETTHPANGWTVVTPRSYYTIDDNAQNPYVRVAIGYSVTWSAQWSTRFDFSHESSIATGLDHGSEKLSLGVTWRPFAK